MKIHAIPGRHGGFDSAEIPEAPWRILDIDIEADTVMHGAARLSGKPAPYEVATF